MAHGNARRRALAPPDRRTDRRPPSSRPGGHDVPAPERRHDGPPRPWQSDASGEGGSMPTSMTGRLFRGREIVDRLARQSPARLAVTVFAAVIAVFTALLMAPWATASGRAAPFVDALFTATSAVCVTGLVVVPTGTYWSTYGQVVILLGIKIGGLGVMTLASILGMAVSRRIGLTQKLLTASETKTTRLGEVGSLVRVVIITSTSLELLIALLLLPPFVVLEESFGEAAWHGGFVGSWALTHAGFTPPEPGLAPYVGAWLLWLPFILGGFLGSLGFPVILNVMRSRRRAAKWWLLTRLPLSPSAVL